MTNVMLMGTIEKVGPDYILWRNGADKRQINFGDNWASTKEYWAATFRGLEGRPAAISTDGPPRLAVTFLPGYFEGTSRVVLSAIPISSVERL